MEKYIITKKNLNDILEIGNKFSQKWKLEMGYSKDKNPYISLFKGRKKLIINHHGVNPDNNYLADQVFNHIIDGFNWMLKNNSDISSGEINNVKWILNKNFNGNFKVSLKSFKLNINVEDKMPNSAIRKAIDEILKYKPETIFIEKWTSEDFKDIQYGIKKSYTDDLYQILYKNYNQK